MNSDKRRFFKAINVGFGIAHSVLILRILLQVRNSLVDSTCIDVPCIQFTSQRPRIILLGFGRWPQERLCDSIMVIIRVSRVVLVLGGNLKDVYLAAVCCALHDGAG